MQLEFFSILPNRYGVKTTDNCVTFRMFISFLEQRLEAQSSFKTKFYEFVLRQFNKIPEVSKPAGVTVLKSNTHLLELLYTCLFPPLNSELDALWALAIPDSDTIFYSTPAFHALMSPANPGGMDATASEEEKVLFYHSLDEVRYALILERVYHVAPVVKEKTIYVWTDKVTGLPKYYNLVVDNRFVDVIQLPGAALPDTGVIQRQLEQVEHLSAMEKTIPLSGFRFEGFSVITATDITRKHALHKMRGEITRLIPGNYQQTYGNMLCLLQAFSGKSYLQFGLLPFLKVNDRLISTVESYPNSIAINVARQQNISWENVSEWLNNQLHHCADGFSDESGDLEISVLQKAISRAGFSGYAVLKLYHNNVLSGLLEINVKPGNIPDQQMLSELDAALPVLGQFLYHHQLEFESSIGKLIRKEFNSIQPAVRWKFNEVAWNLLSGLEKTTCNDIELIRFENVHPLYGSIDVRNSSIERNSALLKDMQMYFVVATETMQSISTIADPALYRLMAEVRQLQALTNLYFSANDETVFINLVDKVNTYLESFAVVHPGSAHRLENYFEAMNRVTGSGYENRRALETSMQLVNRCINHSLESMQVELQQSYPFYFEKFRTDGIEYDMYIGQSIAPLQLYKQDYLYELRRWQLASMAAIARLVRSQAAVMPVHLQTTQLIYVNANPIDISFRTDEKRFDVEGSYNIRYQIVKKRIDKVHVKTTGERLTQPDTISVVYSQKAHGGEYLNYIRGLQAEGLLKPVIEQFELEEMQGVIGLMAIRVGVA